MKVFLIVWISAVLIQEVIPGTLVRLPRHTAKHPATVHTEYEAKYERTGQHGNETCGQFSGKQEFVHENCADNWNSFADKCASLIKDLVASLANTVSSRPGDATKLQLQIKNTFRHFDSTQNCSCLDSTRKNFPNIDFSPLFCNLTVTTVAPSAHNNNGHTAGANNSDGTDNGESHEGENYSVLKRGVVGHGSNCGEGGGGGSSDGHDNFGTTDRPHERGLKTPKRVLDEADYPGFSPESENSSDSNSKDRRQIGYSQVLWQPGNKTRVSHSSKHRSPVNISRSLSPFIVTPPPSSPSGSPAGRINSEDNNPDHGHSGGNGPRSDGGPTANKSSVIAPVYPRAPLMIYKLPGTKSNFPRKPGSDKHSKPASGAPATGSHNSAHPGVRGMLEGLGDHHDATVVPTISAPGAHDSNTHKEYSDPKSPVTDDSSHSKSNISPGLSDSRSSKVPHDPKSPVNSNKAHKNSHSDDCKKPSKNQDNGPVAKVTHPAPFLTQKHSHPDRKIHKWILPTAVPKHGSNDEKDSNVGVPVINCDSNIPELRGPESQLGTTNSLPTDPSPNSASAHLKHATPALPEDVPPTINDDSTQEKTYQPTLREKGTTALPNDDKNGHDEPHQITKIPVSHHGGKHTDCEGDCDSTNKGSGTDPRTEIHNAETTPVVVHPVPTLPPIHVYPHPEDGHHHADDEENGDDEPHHVTTIPISHHDGKHKDSDSDPSRDTHNAETTPVVEHPVPTLPPLSVYPHPESDNHYADDDQNGDDAPHHVRKLPIFHHDDEHNGSDSEPSRDTHNAETTPVKPVPTLPPLHVYPHPEDGNHHAEDDENGDDAPHHVRKIPISHHDDEHNGSDSEPSRDTHNAETTPVVEHPVPTLPPLPVYIHPEDGHHHADDEENGDDEPHHVTTIPISHHDGKHNGSDSEPSRDTHNAETTPVVEHPVPTLPPLPVYIHPEDGHHHADDEENGDDEPHQITKIPISHHDGKHNGSDTDPSRETYNTATTPIVVPTLPPLHVYPHPEDGHHHADDEENGDDEPHHVTTIPISHHDGKHKGSDTDPSRETHDTATTPVAVHPTPTLPPLPVYIHSEDGNHHADDDENEDDEPHHVTTIPISHHDGKHKDSDSDPSRETYNAATTPVVHAVKPLPTLPPLAVEPHPESDSHRANGDHDGHDEPHHVTAIPISDISGKESTTPAVVISVKHVPTLPPVAVESHPESDSHHGNPDHDGHDETHHITTIPVLHSSTLDGHCYDCDGKNEETSSHPKSDTHNHATTPIVTLAVVPTTTVAPLAVQPLLINESQPTHPGSGSDSHHNENNESTVPNVTTPPPYPYWPTDHSPINTDSEGSSDHPENKTHKPTTFQTTSSDPTPPQSILIPTESSPINRKSDAPVPLERSLTGGPLTSSHTTDSHEDDDDNDEDEEDCCDCESFPDYEIKDPKKYKENACKNLEEAKRELKAIFDRIKKTLKCGRCIQSSSANSGKSA